MIFLQDKLTMQLVLVSTAKLTSTNNSPTQQPSITTTAVEEVNKPIEVEDNTSHESNNQAILIDSSSLTSIDEERTHMDMVEISPETTLNKEGPQ